MRTPNMSRSTFAAFFSLLLATGSVVAHETIPATWCPAGKSPVILSTFSFSPMQLQSYKSANERLCAQSRTCGIIDDWFWANDMITAHCGASGLRLLRTPEEAIPFVSSPRSFNATDHHESYRFEQGPLQGQCVVCRNSDTPVPAPPSPAPVDY